MGNLQPTFQAESFNYVYDLIKNAKLNVWRQINTTLIQLYWQIGEYVSAKVQADGWGKGTIAELAQFICLQEPSPKGFSARNIWRMKQFYETYKDSQDLSALLTEISWSNHLHILAKTKDSDEKAFYLTLAVKYHYSEREFARIIDAGTYERTKLADVKLSAPLTVFPISMQGIFKDTYVFDFVNISDSYNEYELKSSLLNNLKKFLLELGPDFSLMDDEYLLQVGMKDFRIDLLMHHRGLNCLVAVELKVTEFKPEHLGKLQFYLEALDRDVKKPHENPTIGILICKTRDEEVVEYALSRNASPAMVAEYETKLIDKRVLRKKLHEQFVINNDIESIL